MSAGTARRSVRISDELWAAAAEIAARRGETISDVLRRELERYVSATASPRVAVGSRRREPR